MDCSEFRRRLLIDPGSPEMANAANARACPDAPARLAEALGFEQALGRALQVEIPGDLADRVIAGAQMQTPAIASGRSWRALAQAASLVLGVLASLGIWMSSRSPTEQLIEASVEHVAHEPYAMTRTEIVPQALVARMFDEAGLRVESRELEVSYLNRCPLGERLSVHMVMAAKNGPVTVLYVPGEGAIERLDSRSAMIAVRTMPFADGALVLLAESNHDFDRIESAWHGWTRKALVASGGL